MHVVPNYWPPQPILWTVSVFATYWRHSTTVAVLPVSQWKVRPIPGCSPSPLTHAPPSHLPMHSSMHATPGITAAMKMRLLGRAWASHSIVGWAWYVHRVHENFLEKPRSPTLGSWWNGTYIACTKVSWRNQEAPHLVVGEMVSTSCTWKFPEQTV